MDMDLNKLQGTGKTGMLQSMRSQRIEHDWVTKQHNNTHSVQGFPFLYTPAST